LSLSLLKLIVAFVFNLSSSLVVNSESIFSLMIFGIEYSKFSDNLSSSSTWLRLILLSSWLSSYYILLISLLSLLTISWSSCVILPPFCINSHLFIIKSCVEINNNILINTKIIHTSNLSINVINNNNICKTLDFNSEYIDSTSINLILFSKNIYKK